MALSHSSSRERLTIAGIGTAVSLVCFGALVASALFVWLATRGPVHSVEPAFGSVALGVAGADRLVVVAYVGIGLTRLYLTGIPLLLGLAGIVAALTGRRWSVPIAVLFGATAAGTLTVLIGCHCASGSTALLAERTARALADGTAPLVVG